MPYLKWDEKIITDFSEPNVAGMYSRGYLFTRLGKGIMDQTRSARIDLSKFELTSENRRILKKVGDIKPKKVSLPMPPEKYDWKIAKMAKDFYDTKFGPGIMSAQKIKEMITDETKSNFNRLLTYSTAVRLQSTEVVPQHVGYAIVYSVASFMHYSYPFYDLNASPKDIGLGMMIMAIQHAKDVGKNFFYMGSLQRPSDTYKLQFHGIEWFDGKKWSGDIEEVKRILASNNINQP
ncbi:hypothetical protein KGQ27_02750 [Patescibacteria group bacterium]|nr:hypothetical protein [Patescibacteria group bacterium]MDE1946787.1 hypothetical protein [Patescibacteria group bacterium]MDE2011081.1 hypothetical protein [Patescibacteria group bacterium]MDE2233138.1 hypothetical protein [Patescibacteria group bacterium]